MKLNNKILLSNVILTLVVFSFTSIGIYYLVNSTVYDELDNHLLQHKVDLIDQVQEDTSSLEMMNQLGTLGSYEWIEITKYDGSTPLNSNEFSTIDTLRNPAEELETNAYRQLTTTISVNDRYYTLKIYEEVAAWTHISRTILISILAGLAIWILLLYILNQLVLDRILTPFYNTVASLEKIADPSDLDESFPETTTYEINVLNRALNTMMQHIRSSFEDQKQFIQNASHELLTPLSIIRQKAEKILSIPELLDRSTIESVGQIQHTAVRLSRLSNALLLISRIENKQFELGERVDIPKVTEAVLEELDDFIRMKNLNITTSFAAPVVVKGNSELLHAAVYNIIQNAIKFSPEGATITISTRRDTEKPCFSVLDEGPGFPPEFIDAAFDRFKKPPPDAAGFNNNSPGLGLSIVQSICQMHHFDCRASNHPEKGAEVSIHF
ncbi:HAMP domain-containing sensor histidine kinase [Fodinibius sediminis]|uniref:histidine kinase n=1 Tax=Fodinibius sediminis TaxID=1214077 RepID=A0A521BK48_9BACT|nr:HAMP domain-containing sensor histidine kinase [Fodinibius sediminis]SMO47493.1 Signal transduction histidine kinase [Fodinibius sediminis]